MNQRNSALFGRSSIAALALAMALPATAAFAQAAPAARPAADAGATVDEIIVTGSRIGRTSYNAPTPVAVVGAQRMAELGISDVGDALNQLPSFRATTTPATNLFRVSSSVAARSMDLRGLGVTRTLTLIDGRRFVPASDNGGVDLNAIPSLLVNRTEVVTGGASAAYGADAVAGVVNVILDSKLQGAKLDVSTGVSEQGDNKTNYVALAAGTGFMDGRGHSIFGAEYSENKGVGDIEHRDWGRRHENYVANSGWPGNGLPATIVSPNVVFVITKGGLIAGGPLKGTQFNTAGQPVPFQFGNPVGGTLMVGGDPVIDAAYIIGNVPLISANKHLSLYSHTDYDFTSSLTGTLELSFADVKGGPVAGADPYDFSKSIAIDNAYLPAATRQAMVAAGVTSIPVSRLSSEFGPLGVGVSDNKTYRVVAALKGDLLADWKWDASYVWGRTDGRVDISNNRYTARWNQAIDAVVGPGGQIVCRSTLTNPGNGCIPFNFFGVPTARPTAATWVIQPAWQTRKFEQHDLSVNLRGSLFDTWAGPVSAAAGAEYRTDRYSGDADPISKAAGFSQNYATPLPAGGQNVTEAYLETNVPLLRDSRFGKSLEVDGAARYTDYSKSGSATTWKLGAVYKLDNQLLFRVTRSKDIRAPSPAELSPVSVVTGLPLLDPATHATYFMNIITSGNPKLELEQANTFTIGGVFQPEFIRNLSISLDYYNIKIQHAIDILAPQATINLCTAGNTQLCQYVVRNGAGQIDSVTSAYQNLSSLKAAGWELVTDYNFDLDDVWSRLDGRMNLALNANYVDHLTTVDATGQKQEFSNWTGNPGSVQNLLGVPRWRANLVATYSRANYSVTAEYRYVPKGLLDPTKIGPEQGGYSPSLPNSANINMVDSRYYLDLSGRIDIGTIGGAKTQIYGVINNVLDVDPPPTLRLYGNPLLFDPVGRNFKLGVRARW